MKRIAPLAFLLLIFLRAPAQTTLNAGDMAVIGMNMTANKMQFVTFRELSVNTVIYLSDYGWDNVAGVFHPSSITAGEMLFKWTVATTVPAGTIFEMSFSLTGSPVVYTFTDLTSNTNITSQLTVQKIAASGDVFVVTGENFFIYQGATNDATYSIPIINPKFICGFNDCVSTVAATNIDASGWSNPVMTVGFAITSSLPGSTGTQGGLVNGTSAIGMVALKRTVNVWYTGPTTAADPATWAARINNVSNWSADATGVITTSLSSPISLSVALGVDFASFTASVRTQTVLLNWQTGVEENASYFEVQRSNDGQSYSSVGKVTARGSNSDYSYTDDLDDIKCRVYYRIKNTDRDGTVGYSRSLKLAGGISTSPLSVYPNPVTGNFINIDIHEGFPQNYAIYDAAGNIVLQGTIGESSKGIDISSVVPGSYYLLLNNTNTIRLHRL